MLHDTRTASRCHTMVAPRQSLEGSAAVAQNDLRAYVAKRDRPASDGHLSSAKDASERWTPGARSASPWQFRHALFMPELARVREDVRCSRERLLARTTGALATQVDRCDRRQPRSALSP